WPVAVRDGVHRGLERCQDLRVVGPEAFDGGREIAAGRLGVWPERVVPDLARPERVGPRLDHGQVVERVSMENLVDPAPRGVAPDRLGGELPRDRDRPTVAVEAPRAKDGRRDIGETGPASLVE